MEPRHDVTIDRFQRRFVPLKSSDSAQRALRQLRAARVPLALVLNSDAAKSPVGIVTWVDLVRRLVAVADEADANPHPGPRADALS
jgi:CBS domain containing-hemolysin-like protein